MVKNREEEQEQIEVAEDNSEDAIFIRKVPVIFCESEECGPEESNS